MSSQLDGKQTDAKPAPAAAAKPKPRFYRIRMSAKRSEQDEDAVPVGFNGNMTRLLRLGEVCVINDSERCILDCSVVPNFKTRITGNKAVMVRTGERKLYDYAILEEITEEAYEAEKQRNKTVAAKDLKDMERSAEMAAVMSGEA